VAAAIAGPDPEHFSERLRQANAWLEASPGRRCVTLADAEYPPLLLQTADPPALLYADGAIDRLSAASVAIVGARHPTAQGAENAHAFAAALSREGLAVVSGLARGIDAAAHEGALPGNTRLAGRIVEQGGLLLSEYAPGSPPLKENFPRRNRIIAGLSLGTLVVEAALRSGSLITARLATEAGREVFAIPGSIHSPQAKGCHALIKQGAKLVEVAADILEELRLVEPSAIEAEGLGDSPDEAEAENDKGQPTDPILRALGHDPATLDALQARTGWPTADLAAGLLELELQGRVARLPGGLYQRLMAA
jgi:DNA processing protein